MPTLFLGEKGVEEFLPRFVHCHLARPTQGGPHFDIWVPLRREPPYTANPNGVTRGTQKGYLLPVKGCDEDLVCQTQA
jgi:hypothetical protein